MTKVIIRAAEPCDAEHVFALLIAFAVSYSPSRSVFESHYPQLLSSEQAELLVACSEEGVIGYLLAFRLLTLYANGPVLEIQELMVAPANRGQGVGRRLVEAALESARSAGCIEVTVPTRRAGEYYIKLGFVETAQFYKRKLDSTQ